MNNGIDKEYNSGVIFRVAVYIRLSREDGDKAESDSIGNQRKLIDHFLDERHDCIVYDRYIDDGWTGTDFRRPAFQRMISDIEAGKANCVVVKDLSRFGRDYIDTGRYLERFFPERDIRFISITDNIDSLKYSYDMLLPIKNIFNEQYARDISRKIHASVNTKQKAGDFIGAFASYGYRKLPSDKNRLIVDDYAASIVRRIFDMYVSGCGKVRIARVLNEQGIVCPAEYKRQSGDNYRNGRRLDQTSYWTYSTINRMLQNEMYLGNMVQGKTSQRMRGKPRIKQREDWIIVHNTHDAIIDIDTWNKVQDLLNRRTRELDMGSNISLFAGFLKCGDCGRAMTRKDHRYNCGTYVRSGRQYCTPHAIAQELLTEIVLSDLTAIIKGITNLRELIVRAAQEVETRMVSDDSIKVDRKLELDKMRRRKKAAYEDFQDGLVSREEYLKYHEEYLKREELLVKQLNDEEEQSNEKSREWSEHPWVKRLLETGVIETLDRDIIVEMVGEIRVYDNGRVSIAYKFDGQNLLAQGADKEVD